MVLLEELMASACIPYTEAIQPYSTVMVRSPRMKFDAIVSESSVLLHVFGWFDKVYTVIIILQLYDCWR